MFVSGWAISNLIMQMLRKQKRLFSLELSQVFSKNRLENKDVQNVFKLLDGNLLDHSNFLNRKKGDLDETLLHYYARSDNEPHDEIVCDLLLTNGADINCIDNNEKTPLHRSVIAGKSSISELLLSHCAYVNAQDAHGNTPLHYASTLTPKLCALLLKCGADPNIKNSLKETPLFHAVRSVSNALPHCKEIVKLLLNHGGSVAGRKLNEDDAFRVDSKDVVDWWKQNEKNSGGKS